MEQAEHLGQMEHGKRRAPGLLVLAMKELAVTGMGLRPEVNLL